MRNFSKFFLLTLILGMIPILLAQAPVGLSKEFVGAYNAYYTIWNPSPVPDGDTYFFSAWGSDGTGTLPSMLPLFPTTTGGSLTIIGTRNDAGGFGSCSGGNIQLEQLTKIGAAGATMTTSNLLIDPFPNCMDDFGTMSSDPNTPAGWNGSPGFPSGATGYSWKNPPPAFRNNDLYIYPFRQVSGGAGFGDATLIKSADAGKHWIDYSRYSTYTITGATCVASVVTLTVANALAGTEVIYIHGMAPSAWNVDGMQALTAATGATATYTIKDRFGSTQSCPGSAWTSGGNFGIMSTHGSAPSYGSGTMMWEGSNVMKVISVPNYGQDGSYPAGIEAACDPTVYVCGISQTKTSGAGGGGPADVYVWQVPIGREMEKSAYKWITCPGQSKYWGIPGNACSTGSAASWTSTEASATSVLWNWGTGAGWSPGDCQTVTYISETKSYVMSCSQNAVDFRYNQLWAPSLGGPWYPTMVSDTYPASFASFVSAFISVLPINKTVISANPPYTQYLVSANTGGFGSFPGGTPNFGALEYGPGRVEGNSIGAAPIGKFLGVQGYDGTGHKLTTGPGGITRRGAYEILGSGPALYSYCKVLTTTAAMVQGGSALTNYVHLISIADADLRTVSDGGLVNNSNGYDIGIGPDCSGTGILYPFELQSYSSNGSTGTIIVNALRSTYPVGGNPAVADTVGVYYGGPQTSDQSTPTVVWSGYYAAYHLDEASSAQAVDVTGNGKSSTSASTSQVAGVVGNAQSFTKASNQSIILPPLANPVDFTIMSWIKAPNTSDACDILDGLSGGSAGPLFYCDNTTGGVASAYYNPPGTFTPSVTNVEDNTFHFVAYSRQGNTTTIQVDGNTPITQTVTTNSAWGTTTRIAEDSIGGFYTQTSDELRMANSALTTGTVQTYRLNQLQPGTYESLGSRVTLSPGANLGTYQLAWWFDGWDHGGNTTATNRPFFRDLVSGGTAFLSKYVDTSTTNAFSGSVTSPTGNSCTSFANNCLAYGGIVGAAAPNFTDTTMQANSSWSFMGTMVSLTSYGPSSTGGPPTPVFGVATAALTSNPGSFAAAGLQLQVLIGMRNANDVCVAYGYVNTYYATFCTPGGAVSSSTSLTTIMVSANANPVGFPDFLIGVGSDGVLVQYGGLPGLATAANNTTINGLTKLCVSCAVTPAVTATSYWFQQQPTQYAAPVAGAYGDYGLFSGYVPANAQASIYTALMRDYRLTGRWGCTPSACLN